MMKWKQNKTDWKDNFSQRIKHYLSGVTALGLMTLFGLSLSANAQVAEETTADFPSAVSQTTQRAITDGVNSDEDDVLLIEITGDGASSGIPILVAPFLTEGVRPSVNLAKIISDDLARSGRFKLVAAHRVAQVPRFGMPLDLDAMDNAGIEYVITGRVMPSANQFDLEVEVLDTISGNRVAGFRLPGSVRNKRRMAHKAADLVFEKLTKIKGAFDTRIVYVSAQGNARGRTFRLIVADSDGHNPKTILTSRKPIMSPSWAPDGRRIAYVSYESGRPSVYVQDVFTGSKRRLTSFRGINSAPSWSPDGNRLAVSLSKDGNPEVYIVDVGSGALRRVTRFRSIDTEPVWANNNTLIFTSDRGGKPQLYRVSAAGGTPQRITFSGSYNTAADVAEGKVTMVHRAGGAFRIAVQDLVHGGSDVISRGHLDESPSLAPNGTMVLYSTESNGRGVLAVTSDNGEAHQFLYAQSGDVRDPAWSPYIK